jgi:alginate O-acetyltransferase complex protein AlgI
MMVVFCGWAFFRTETLTEAFAYLHRMFVPYKIDETVVLWNREFQIVLVLSILCCGLVSGLFAWLPIKETIKQKVVKIGTPVFCAVVTYLSLLMLASNTYNPFIYFRF